MAILSLISFQDVVSLAPSLKQAMNDYDISTSADIEKRIAKGFSIAGTDMFPFCEFHVSAVGDSNSKIIGIANMSQVYSDKTYPGANMDSTVLLYTKVDPSLPGYVLAYGDNLEETSYTLHCC